MRQIREVILLRQVSDWRRHVALEEAKLKILVGAMYGANRNKAGARVAGRIRLQEPEDPTSNVPSVTSIAGGMGSGGGKPAYSQDDIDAEIARLRAAGELPPAPGGG